MIQITWGTAIALVAFISVVGPGFYWIGRTSKQVDVNTKDIKVIFGKLDAIYDYVKNGRK